MIMELKIYRTPHSSTGQSESKNLDRFLDLIGGNHRTVRRVKKSVFLYNGPINRTKIRLRYLNSIFAGILLIY